MRTAVGIVVVWRLTACTPPRSTQPPIANQAATPDEVHVVVAPALGFTGEQDAPLRWRLERTGARAMLSIASRDHREQHLAGAVAIHGASLDYELAEGDDRIALACKRGPVRVHPPGARLLRRPAPVRCDDPPPWQPSDEVTIVALVCTLEPRSPAAPRARVLTFAPLPGFDAVEDRCCVGDSCDVRWDIRMR